MEFYFQCMQNICTNDESKSMDEGWAYSELHQLWMITHEGRVKTSICNNNGGVPLCQVGDLDIVPDSDIGDCDA